MSKQRHIIGRTVLILDTGRIADVSSLQEDMSRLFQQQGVPAMERLFDQLVGDEEVVRLDQVVVEVGSVDRRFLADEFIHKLLDALNQTLGDRLVAGAKTEEIPRDRIGSEDETNRRSLQNIEDRPRRDWEVLLYFLASGHLPREQASEDLLTWLLRWETIIQTETVWQMPLRELLRNNVAAPQRLVAHLPEPLRHYSQLGQIGTPCWHKQEF